MSARGSAAADRLRARRHRHTCTRCRQPAPRVTPAYWDPATRLCPACCEQVADDHDRTGWPARPPTKETPAA